MLTRLKVSGFKNLVDVDVRFGPFTCIAGINGVGKSNLLDAIRFLSALADQPPAEAAQSVRTEGKQTNGIDRLFLRMGEETMEEMTFEAEMIVPREFVDDLGRLRFAKSTFLRYKVAISRRRKGQAPPAIVHEELVRVRKTRPPFPHETPWATSVLFGNAEQTLLSLEERLFRGAKRRLPLKEVSAPQTLVSFETALGNPTVLAARREMQSWRLLQLEPAILREADSLGGPTSLGTQGAHLAATLFRLAHSDRPPSGNGKDMSTEQVFGQLAVRLSELLGGVRDVWVESDDRRQTLTVMVTDRTGTSHPSQALSDGTLRFLALAVLELDPQAQGLICLEEPENGIHPDRIPAMLRLLQDIPADTNEPAAPDNPLRQVIINTHSPAVVAQVPDDSLLIAEPQEMVLGGQRFLGVMFKSLPGTWRAQTGAPTVARGQLMTYLNPIPPQNPEELHHRVVDREDLQILLPR